MSLYIARDEEGSLYLYDEVPEKRNGYFMPNRGYNSIVLDDRLFPEITFSNSPQKVELKLI